MSNVSSSLWPWSRDDINDEDTKNIIESSNKTPSEFNTLNYGKFLEVSTDKLSVKYTGEGAHSNDVGAIQANCPIPSQRLVYYFECEVKDSGIRKCIAIGFSDEAFKLFRHAGWEPGSYGYHGEDGKKYSGSYSGDVYSSGFSTGDVVGAGVNLCKREIFFTQNGRMLGPAFINVKLPLYPTVSLHSKNEHVVANFGQKPFVFDIQEYIAQERHHLYTSRQHAPLSSTITHGVVREFLEHYACAATLRALDASWLGEAPSGAPLTGEVQLTRRAQLRAQLLRGEVQAARLALDELFPQAARDPLVEFHLACQEFLELVGSGKPLEAVALARSSLAPYRGLSAQGDRVLAQVVATLAYQDPATASAVGHLCSPQQREVTADIVTAAILHCSSQDQIQGPRAASAPEDLDKTPHPSLPVALNSSLERMLRQVVICHNELRDVNCAQGELFRLDEALALH